MNERQSNVQNYNRGMFDLSLSFVHSVEFRFVGHVFGFFLDRMMAANDPVQERQLVLMERMSRRIDSILEGQKKLEDTNAVLQQKNAKLKNQLASLQGQAKRKGNKRSKSSRRESNVVIPNYLRVSILFDYFKDINIFNFSTVKLCFRFSVAVHQKHKTCL